MTPLPRWSVASTPIDRTTVRHRLLLDQAPASFGATLSALCDDSALRDTLLAQLRSSPFSAFFWETPAIAAESLTRAFEFVLVDAPSLGRGLADGSPFRRQLGSAPAGTSAVAFPSLGRDALLIAPTRRSATADYGHLAGFVRTAPEDQQHELLRLVARSALDRAAALRTWISTSGLGVAWLHVRLDSVPKYYQFAPFRDD